MGEKWQIGAPVVEDEDIDPSELGKTIFKSQAEARKKVEELRKITGDESWIVFPFFKGDKKEQNKYFLVTQIEEPEGLGYKVLGLTFKLFFYGLIIGILLTVLWIIF